MNILDQREYAGVIDVDPRSMVDDDDTVCRAQARLDEAEFWPTERHHMMGKNNDV